MNRALLAADEKDLKLELERCLTDLGWESIQADCDQALGLLKSSDLSELPLIFLSATSPRLAALSEAAKTLNPHILRIGIADLDSRSDLRHAISSGFIDDFLPLPFSIADVKGLFKLLRTG